MRIYLTLIGLLIACTPTSDQPVDVYQAVYSRLMDLYPQQATRVGNPTGNDKLDDLSNAVALRLFALGDFIESHRIDTLSADVQRKLRALVAVTRFINAYWYYIPKITPEDGLHLTLIPYLASNHPIEDQRDMEYLIRRMEDSKRKLRSLLKGLEIQRNRNLLELDAKVLTQLDSVTAVPFVSTPLAKRVDTLALPTIKTQTDRLAYQYENVFIKRLKRLRKTVAEIGSSRLPKEKRSDLRRAFRTLIREYPEVYPGKGRADRLFQAFQADFRRIERVIEN